MNRIVIGLSAGLLIFVLACDRVWAQAAAAISGTVRDQSGAVLPGVEVAATQTDTGVTRNTVTNETGSYVLPNLPLGPYRLEAALPGFRTYVQTGIVLQVNTSPVINPVLEVGQVTEQVEVQANATLVETRNSGVGQVIENQRILELPLNGRNVIELIALAGAATPGTGVSGGSRDPFNPNAISIAGGLAFGVSYVLDGAMHNNPYTNQSLSVPFPDALQEFKVETSAMSAQTGIHSAGSVNLVTKSGTNEWHGNLFEFVRNGKFNARNAYALRRDTLKRNQFGGTLGGPIKPNTLFFFAGYQGTARRQDPSDVQAFVPTPAMLAGDFTAITSPACNAGRQISLRAPFINNRIDPTLFSKAALNLVAKLPTTSDPCGKVIFGNPSRFNQHMAVGKIDYQRTANHFLFGRYVIDSLKDPDPYTLNNNLLSLNVSGGDGLNQAFTVGSTYLFGPTVVNSLRLTANRSATIRLAGETFTLADLGVKMYSYHPRLFKVGVTGAFPQATNTGPTNSAIFAISDDVSVLRGNHQLAFGGSAGRWTSNQYSFFYAAGSANFNGQITGLGMADFLTGNVFTFTQAPNEVHTGYQWYLGPYATDTWKATRNLTVIYGLRWEPFFPQQFTDGTAYQVDLDALRKGVRTTQYKNAPPGVFYPGDAQYKSGAKSPMYNQWLNLSPRVGLAWDPRGDGGTSIRAAFGMFYDFVSMGYHVGTNIAPPWNPRVTLQNVSFDDPWRDFPGGNPFPTPTGSEALFTPYSVYAVLRPDTRNPTVSQWNLSVQRQIGTDWLVSASYLGSNTAHLWTVKPANSAVYIPGASCVLSGRTWSPCSSTANTDQRRVLSLENPATGQFYGYVNEVDDGGTANYHGLILSAQRRASRGVTLNANYTWSHCISDPWQALLNGGRGDGAYTDPNNRRADRGNCTTSATDQRHVFNMTAVAETPQFSSPTLRAVATGWRLSPIIRIQSGSYLSVTTSSDIALSSIGSQRVNQVLPDVYGDKSTNQYLNPQAFALPATGTRGNLGAGNILGPGTWQFDLALSRIFRFGETQRLEFRAEAFNVTNSVRKNDPTTNLNSNIFGQINSARDPRIMQFALKYVF